MPLIRICKYVQNNVSNIRKYDFQINKPSRTKKSLPLGQQHEYHNKVRKSALRLPLYLAQALAKRVRPGDPQRACLWLIDDRQCTTTL